MTDEMLTEALHHERTEGGTQNVDCWACEAAKSPAINSLLKARNAAEARADHAEMVLARAVPDEEAQMELWRAHWRAQIAARRAEGSAGEACAEPAHGVVDLVERRLGEHSSNPREDR